MVISTPSTFSPSKPIALFDYGALEDFFTVESECVRCFVPPEVSKEKLLSAS
jgi:hypothetical protein